MNPFSLPINDSSLYLYREQQRILKVEHEKEMRSIPIYDRSPESKIPIISELRKTSLPPITSPSKFRRNSLVVIREDLSELIHRKREILLVKKSIETKLKNIEMLENSVTERERNQKEFVKKLEDEMHMFEKYEEKLMLETRKKSENTKKKSLERAKLQENLKNLGEKIEAMQVSLEKRTEELKKYEKIKEFVEEVSLNLNEKVESSMFVTEQHPLFRAPLQILDLLNAFEAKSLFLVKQVETDEQGLELLKANNRILLSEIEFDMEKIDNQLKTLEKQKESLLEKLKKSGKDTKCDQMMSESTLEAIHLKLIEMAEIIGTDPTLQLNDLDILELIESRMKKMVKKCEEYDEETVKKLEKDIDKVRRSQNIEKLKQIEKQKNLENSEKLKARKNKVIKKHGRNLKPKSKIAEKVAVVEAEEIPQDLLDRIEFLDEVMPGK